MSLTNGGGGLLYENIDIIWKSLDFLFRKIWVPLSWILSISLWKKFLNTDVLSYVYWTVHHLDSWIRRDQLDVTCFIISLFNAQHVSDVNTSILRSLRLICWVISWVVLIWFDVCWCYVVVWLWWCGIRMQAEALVHVTCWALNRAIIKQVTSSWSPFIQLMY